MPKAGTTTTESGSDVTNGFFTTPPPASPQHAKAFLHGFRLPELEGDMWAPARQAARGSGPCCYLGF